MSAVAALTKQIRRELFDNEGRRPGRTINAVLDWNNDLVELAHDEIAMMARLYWERWLVDNVEPTPKLQAAQRAAEFASGLPYRRSIRTQVKLFLLYQPGGLRSDIAAIRAANRER